MALPSIDNSSESFNYEKLSQINKLNKKSSEYYTTQRTDLLVVKNSEGEEIVSYTRGTNDENSGFSGYDYSENPIIGESSDVGLDLKLENGTIMMRTGI